MLTYLLLILPPGQWNHWLWLVGRRAPSLPRFLRGFQRPAKRIEEA